MVGNGIPRNRAAPVYRDVCRYDGYRGRGHAALTPGDDSELPFEVQSARRRGVLHDETAPALRSGRGLSVRVSRAYVIRWVKPYPAHRF